MAKSQQNLLLGLHWSLYEKAYEEANALPIIDSPRFVQYAKNFEKILPKYFNKIDLKSVLNVIHSHNIVLYGDFHTFKQSQKGFLRLVRNYVDKYSHDNVIIAVECIKAKDQSKIDKFLNNDLCEEKFLEAINYFEDWGFPWDHYKDIFEFAKKYSIKVVGINLKTRGKGSLKIRDNFIAKILLDILEKEPNKKVFCIVGEYHLADKHLPLSLYKKSKSNISVVRILNNVDRYYFELDMLHSDEDIYLHLKDDLYCVMNAPLWIKWQSLANWEEMEYAVKLKPHNKIYHISRYDIDNLKNQFFDIVENLGYFLHVNISKLELDNINILFNINSLNNGIKQLLQHISAEELLKIEYRAIKDGFYVLNYNKTIILADFSLNTISEAAGQYLYILSQIYDDYVSWSDQDRFYFRVLKSMSGYISSRILNPRRKLENVWVYQEIIKDRFVKLGYQKLKKYAANLALKYHKWLQFKSLNNTHKSSNVFKNIYKKDIELNYEVSKVLGYIVGSLFYQGVISGSIPISVLRNFFINTPYKRSDIEVLLNYIYSCLAQ